MNGMIKAVDHLLEMVDEETKIISGHGPLTDRKGLEKYRHLLVTVRDCVRNQMKEGKTLEEILASNPTEGFEKMGIGVPAEMFVTIIYNDLSQK